MQKKMTYEQAMEQLERIVNELEQGQLSIDKLSATIKEAKALVDFCHDKLVLVEEEVRKIMPEDDKL